MSSFEKVAVKSVSFGLLNAQSIGNKSTAVVSIIEDSRLDVFLLTETWHTTPDDTALRRCIPAGYERLDTPRMTSDPSRTNHGGIATIVSWNLSWKRISPPLKPATFESMFAPVRSVTVRRQRIAVWIDSECTQLRRLSRKNAGAPIQKDEITFR